MLIDTSVLVAVHNKEIGFESYLRKIARAERRWVSAVSYLELILVTKNLTWIDGFFRAAEITIIEVLPSDIDEAVHGFFVYGKGSHPAGLNFGDCVVYGTAKARDLQLLFKGGDFSQTDLKLIPIKEE